MKKRNFLNFFKIVAGCAISSGALTLILKPGNMAPGGAGALAAILSDMLYVRIGTAILIINIPLLFLAFGAGRQFLLKTLLGTFLFSIFANLWEEVSFPQLDNMLRAIFGGAALGTGLGLIFTSGASSGGSDILAHFISRKKPHIKVSRAILIVDALIILLQAIYYKSLESALFAIIALFVSAFFLDKVMEGFSEPLKTLYIISEMAAEIKKRVFSEINRGMTALSGEGMYSGRKKAVLMCTIYGRELPLIKNIISDIDSDAFVIITDTREVLGKGFDNIDR